MKSSYNVHMWITQKRTTLHHIAVLARVLLHTAAMLWSCIIQQQCIYAVNVDQLVVLGCMASLIIERLCTVVQVA